MMKLCEKVFRLRKDRGLSLDAFAEGIDFDSFLLGDMESGGYRPTYSAAKIYADFFHVPLDWLADDSADWPPPEWRVECDRAKMNFAECTPASVENVAADQLLNACRHASEVIHTIVDVIMEAGLKSYCGVSLAKCIEAYQACQEINRVVVDTFLVDEDFDDDGDASGETEAAIKKQIEKIEKSDERNH